MATYINHYYVYFIRDTLGHMKIGMSDDVRARIRELQVGNPMKLDYFYCMLIEGKDNARKLEKWLHKKFSHVRLQGEWFDEAEIVEWVSKDFIKINFNGGTYEFVGRNIWTKEMF